MEKEFISYEQALALKELGFDEPCFGKYLSSLQSNWKEYELILEMGMNEEFEDNRNVYFLEKTCSAPTFSQAFRWFREKYGLFHSITEYNKDGSLIIEISKDRVEIFRKMTNFDFTEYREVELECLKKLIEIVKQK